LDFFLIKDILYFPIDGFFYCSASPSIIFTFMGTSPLPVKCCKIKVYSRRSTPLSREGSLSCHICCDTGPRFFFLPDATPFSRLLRHTRGCGGPILTRNLTGYKQMECQIHMFILQFPSLLFMVPQINVKSSNWNFWVCQSSFDLCNYPSPNN
jgi:hypothetical protein